MEKIDIKSIEQQCKLAKESHVKTGKLSTDIKNLALRKIAVSIRENISFVIEANKKDINSAIESGLSGPLVDRLTLDEQRLLNIANSVETIASLEDPIGAIIDDWTVENGLRISKVRVPLGVIGIVYEARPNVTIDAAALALKTGNAIILRGSSSAMESNLALVRLFKEVLFDVSILPEIVQLLMDTSHESVIDFIRMDDYLDVVIPRGSSTLIETVVKNATVPTIETGIGNCHVFIDKYANLENAKKIIINSKTHRPTVCNSAESLLLHSDLDTTFISSVLSSLTSLGVTIKGCKRINELYKNSHPASELDYYTEFLDLRLSVKIVDSVEQAIEHISKFGSHHTESIVSENSHSIQMFIDNIDAAAVLVNASTRFTDGGEFGFGAEMGISTQKMHPRGPMGLAELTTYKYIVRGNGHIRK